jgi:hypothetical protein
MAVRYSFTSMVANMRNKDPWENLKASFEKSNYSYLLPTLESVHQWSNPRF